MKGFSMGYDIILADATRDVFLTNGDLILSDGLARVRQEIGITLRAWRGEWFLDLDFGIPYLQNVLVKEPQRVVLQSIFAAAIASVPDVEAVESLTATLDRPSRTLSIVFSARTRFGMVSDSIPFGIGGA
ncbi:Phage-related protein [Granulibacter bethesdensis]|uniref:Phage-related protein n=2 Tax=Granulibacter bethesdensis TaxID=364410 RepID=A0AAN0REJ6_9PROT|nr:Phage-related protein [Granulibacter bethesdensis]APH57388.1 Phage-related protein [Granulibacter bethesdensis]